MNTFFSSFLFTSLTVLQMLPKIFHGRVFRTRHGFVFIMALSFVVAEFLMAERICSYFCLRPFILYTYSLLYKKIAFTLRHTCIFLL